MANEWVLGRYFPADSSVHRLDARVKLVTGLVFAVVVFVVKAWVGLLYLAVVTALATALAGVPVVAVLKGLRPVLLLIALSALFHIVFTPGTPALAWGKVSVSQEGIRVAAFLSARLAVLIVGLQIVTLTTAPLAMTDAVAWLLKPGQRIGIPAAEIALMMTIAVTFFPTLQDELQRIIRAQSARGATFNAGGPWRRAGALVPIIVPLFTGVLRRAEALSVAMESRGYHSSAARTRWKGTAWTPADSRVLALSILGLVWIGWKFG